MDEVLKVEKGCFSYTPSRPLLKDVSFSLHAGQVMAVMGRNGIGKTTLIKCIAGILNWESGCSFVVGKRSRKNHPIKEIGYVPQAHKVSFSYSVRDMVVFGRVGRGSRFATPGRQDYALADQMLEQLDIAQLREQPCSTLSGGQLQMVFIARALVNDPRLLILDEPESHLDFRNQIRLLKLIRSVADERRMACILNTHYPNHALRIADRCFLLEEASYTTGSALQVMTDENIRTYFGVTSHSVRFQHEGETITSFFFLDEA